MNEQPKLSPLDQAHRNCAALAAEIADLRAQLPALQRDQAEAVKAGAIGSATSKREADKLADTIARNERNIAIREDILAQEQETVRTLNEAEADLAFQAEALEKKADAETCTLIASALDAALDTVGKLHTDLAKQIGKLSGASPRIRSEIYPELPQQAANVMQTIKSRLGYHRVIDEPVLDYSGPASSVERQMRIALRSLVDEKGAGK